MTVNTPSSPPLKRVVIEFIVFVELSQNKSSSRHAPAILLPSAAASEHGQRLRYLRQGKATGIVFYMRIMITAAVLFVAIPLLHEVETALTLLVCEWCGGVAYGQI